MKGAVLTVLCAIALTHGATVLNKNGCPTDPLVQKLLPHSECDRYYRCLLGNLFEMPCPAGLHFSVATNVCEAPEVANCQNKVNAPIDHNVETGSDKTRQANVVCAASDSEGVLVPHENCNYFYKCNYGLPVAMVCPSVTLYDPIQELCDWPENVECAGRPIVESDNNGNNDGGWTGNGDGNDDPSQAAAICAAENSDHSYVAHEYCNYFYQCWASSPVALRCPAGLLFNPQRDYCDFPSNVDCGSRIIPDDFDVDTGDQNGNNPITDEIPVGNNNNNPSLAPSICAADDSEGVLIAHENCNQFYICNGGRPVAQICPGNLLFDPTRDRCEWRDIVECGNRVIPEDNGNGGSEWDPNTGGNNNDPSQAAAICAAEGSDHVMIAHENCNQFYQCWAGRPIALTCPENLFFNPKNDWCDFPSNVDCGSRIIPESSGNPTGNNNPNIEDEIPVGDNNNNPSLAPSICAADDSEGVLIAHENCNQFYICNGGRPVAQICPGNLLFDPTRDRCEWRDIVECGNRVIPEDDGNGGSEWDPNTGGNNNDPSQATAICAAEGSDHVMIAHENCNQFYQCWAGRPIALTCPENLFFNPKNDWCDFPSNVDCGSRIIPEGSGNPTGNNNPNIEDEIPVGNNNNNPSLAPSICAADDSEGVLIAHENCNQFYICNGGRPVAQICPGNLLFDPTRDRCEWRDIVECGNRVIPEDNGNGGSEWDPNTGGNNNDPSQAAAICAAEGSDHVMIAHENCNQFYQCWAGRPIALTCPENLFFNPKNDWCDFPSNVDCGSRVISEASSDQNVKDDIPVGDNNNNPSLAPSICAADDSEGVLVAHENCNQFFICSGGKPVAQTCPRNLLFDPTRDRCEWRDIVECGNRVIPAPEDNDNDGSEWDPNTGGNNNDPSQAAAICAAEGSDHVMIAHENCNQFYQCWAGRAVVLTCPENLFFNPRNDWCDFASNVDCSNRLVK